MKALKITGNIFFYLIILLLLLFSIANITIQSNNGIPNVFGYGFTAVRSGSMDGDKSDSFPKYSLVFIKVGTPESTEDLREEKDILVYIGRVEGREDFIIHRYIQKAGDFLITKGDANPSTDPLIRLDQVKGKYIGHIPLIGGVMLFLQTPTGFAVGVLLPLSILLIFQLIVVIRVWNQRSKEVLTTQFESDKERMRREIEEELLAKLANRQKTEDNQDNTE